MDPSGVADSEVPGVSEPDFSRALYSNITFTSSHSSSSDPVLFLGGVVGVLDVDVQPDAQQLAQSLAGPVFLAGGLHELALFDVLLVADAVDLGHFHFPLFLRPHVVYVRM